jgi:hypothetical protein
MNQCRRVFLFTLCAFAVALHLHARAQQQNAPGEYADAPQVLVQIALIEKMLPTLPDRGAALFGLAAVCSEFRARSCHRGLQSFACSPDGLHVSHTIILEAGSILQESREPFGVYLRAWQSGKRL